MVELLLDWIESQPRKALGRCRASIIVLASRVK
jgi:hypothetical protein